MQQKEYKKNVLISAFNCSPYAGSEQYLGWSSAVATANYGWCCGSSGCTYCKRC